VVPNDGRRAQRKRTFAELLVDPRVRERFEKIRKYFFLRESTYDMSNRCNMRCDGCYYYRGEKQFARENRDPEAWRKLMREEKKRGITYVVLAGAEPSLVPELLQVCYDEIPLGCIATNGLIRIPESVGHKIHISVWGNDKTSHRVRRKKDLLCRQLEAYQGDPRVVFVYTFTRSNIPEIYEVMEVLAAKDVRVTFNVFSAPMGYNGELRLDEPALAETRMTMLDVMANFPDNVLFSPYNVVAHTHRYGLHKLYSCPYPRANESTFIGLGRSFRQYRIDLTWDRSVACCVPDTDCEDCRHYASGSAMVTARMHRHATDSHHFRAWLDYVDTYLSVWVMNYPKGENLCPELIPPPGHDLT
jgi:organic radical activating enzyme